MKIHVSEGSDEIKQNAETDGISRDQAPVAQVPHHLRDRRYDPAAGANEIALSRQHRGNDDGGDQGEQRHDLDRRAPADYIGQKTGNEPSAKSADGGAGNV